MGLCNGEFQESSSKSSLLIIDRFLETATWNEMTYNKISFTKS